MTVWAFPFRPQLIDSFKQYSQADFRADVSAGVTVGIVALPLAMAFAIASGVSPQAGIFTAIIAGFLISALGGTKVCIGGPTGAFIVIIYGIVVKYGVANLLICTFMAGIFLILMGVMRLGSLIKFFPSPLITGFTNGIAVLILLTQLKDFFGLQIEKMPSGFFESLFALYHHAHTLHFPTFLMALGCFLLIRFWPKAWMRILPAPIMALVTATLLTVFFALPLQTIGTKFGGIPQGFPPFSLPDLSWTHLRDLIPPAFTIALLGAVESLLCAVVADGMTDDKHDSNQELIAQGIANVVSPFFGGIPATGAIARTAANVRLGARSPVAGIVHALALLAIVLVAAPLAKYIPLAALAAILISVALNMGEWEGFTHLKKYPKNDSMVLMVTFIFTVVFDLTLAVGAGMILAAVLFIKRMSDETYVDALEPGKETELESQLLKERSIPEGVVIFRVQGALFFGAADKLELVLRQVHQEPEVLILRMNRVFGIDATALIALESVLKKLEQHGKHLVLCGVQEQPLRLMQQAGFISTLGEHNIQVSLEEALDHADNLLLASSSSQWIH